jgi:signal transduction histidine kinase
MPCSFEYQTVDSVTTEPSIDRLALVRRAGAALREVSDDVPSLLEQLGRELNCAAVVVLRPHGSRVIADFAWRVHEWWLGTVPLGALTTEDLERLAPVEAIELGAAAAKVPPQLSWDAGRAATGPAVVGVAGGTERLSELEMHILATVVEIVIARDIASISLRMNSLLRERARIASAIHEGVVQDLATLTLQLEVLDQLIGREPERAVQLAGEARITAANALDETRAAILDLAPVVPDNTWFVSGLREFIDDFARQWDLDLSFGVTGKVRTVETESLSLIFAFTQEALTNLRKHSGCRRGDVHLGFDDDRLRLSIRSEGPACGGNGGGRVWPTGQGIKLMRGRARLLGGDVQLTRLRDNQTRVSLRLPT